MKSIKQFINNALYTFFMFAGMLLELPSMILYDIAFLFTEDDDNNEEETDGE